MLKTRYKLPLSTMLLWLMLAVFVACSHSDCPSDNTRIERLRQLDDSIVALAPSAHDSIRRGLASACDSISFYEYRLREAHYYWLSERPERADTILPQIINFVQRQDDGTYAKQHVYSSPRLNSLIGGALACQAGRNHNFHYGPQKSIELYSKAYRFIAHSESKSTMPSLCANLGDAYMQANEVPNAAKWYRRALFLVDSLELPKKENVTLYMGLAQIYLSLHDFHTAKQYYDETEYYFDTMSPAMQAYYLNNLGNYFYYSHKYNDALKVFLRLKQLLTKKEMDKQFDMYLCKINLADVYLNLNQLDEAQKYLDDVEPFFRRTGDPVAAYYCNTIRIGIAERRGDNATVQRVIAEEKRDKRAEVPYNLVDIRDKYMCSHYEKTGDYRKAYALLERNISYNDSLEHNRSNMRSAEIMARFTADTLKLHHDLALEHKNAVIQQANQKTTLAVAVAAVLLMIFISWLFYTRKKQMQDQMKVMNLKLDIIRNRISPHFMFNVLNNKILKSEEKEASELMELARLIRTNLDMSSMPSVSLIDEIAFVRQYINVETYLLGDDFEFAVNISDDVDTANTKIPAMFIQILTENSIVHGLKALDGHKSLHIDIRRDTNDDTIIDVTDNGPGFNARRALKKGTGLNIISQTVALINEHNKLKMRFEINNRMDEMGNIIGCKSTLRVPKNLTI